DLSRSVESASDRVQNSRAAHPSTMLRDATFLNAVLPFALAQARRHREPLSLLCIEIDRLNGIQELLGRATADRLVRSVGETVASMIRGSDIVVRLDDDRVVAILPRSAGEGALQLGEKICRTVADRCQVVGESPGVSATVSIGVAAFPRSARSVFS